MTAYIVIAFTNVQTQGENVIKIYDDTTEKFFTDEATAELYSQYLAEKGKNTLISPINILSTIDINFLKISDALAKLTETDKMLLGLT